jgi:hypothetical protein
MQCVINNLVFAEKYQIEKGNNILAHRRQKFY